MVNKMEKADTRRKIMFYLNPEGSAAERYVCGEIDRLPQGERGKVWRAALLSGFALRKQDPRLTNMLAEFLDDRTTFEDMVLIMQAVFPEEMKNFGNRGPASALPVSTSSRPDENRTEQDETRSNARAMFGQSEKGRGNQ